MMDIKNIPKKRLFIGLTLWAILIAAVIGIFASGGDKNEAQQTNQSVDIGQEGYLVGDGQFPVMAAASKEDFDALSKALVANDSMGLLELASSGRVVYIPTGTKVLVTDRSFGSRQVRVLEGDLIGKTGWVHMELVKASYEPPSGE